MFYVEHGVLALEFYLERVLRWSVGKECFDMGCQLRRVNNVRAAFECIEAKPAELAYDGFFFRGEPFCADFALVSACDVELLMEACWGFRCFQLYRPG